MRTSPVEIAAWIVIGVAVNHFLRELLSQGTRGREQIAARLEYEDVATTEERKRLLLARYADVIVERPAQTFVAAARAYLKMKPNDYAFFGISYGIGALGLFVLYLLFRFIAN